MLGVYTVLSGFFINCMGMFIHFNKEALSIVMMCMSYVIMGRGS